MNTATLAQTQPWTRELRQWVQSQVAQGCRPADMLQAMLASGWRLDVAHEALSLLAPAPQAGRRPSDDASPARPEIVAGGPRTLLTMNRPRLTLYGGLLSDAECEALIALAGPRLSRSETVQDRTGGSEVNAARTSEGMFFSRGETPLVEAIEQRIAALLNWPVGQGEGLQVLRYRPGAQYRPHFDYFDPAQPGTQELLRGGGQRVATLLMYLNTPLQGGATTFPDADLEIAAVKGHALFFAYDRPHPDTLTLHGGAPVIEGEKWVATKWLRADPVT